MNNIILHIPHSSERLPREFFTGTIISKTKLRGFCHLIADNKTKELFGMNKYKKVVFNWSRIFCDVEKFIDPAKEEMAAFGMGVIYTKTNLGETFREVSGGYSNKIIEKYYIPHHKKLDELAKKSVLKAPTILVDCHSFCKDIIMFSEKKVDLPDICVGSNEPSKLANFVMEYFARLGYKVKENYPYSGSMIPDCFLDCPNPNFFSVMIEVNKELYLDNQHNFEKLQKEINALLKKLEHFEINQQKNR